MALSRASMGFLGYISVSCLPAESGNAGGLALGRHSRGHWNNKVSGLHQGLVQLSPDQTVSDKLMLSLAELLVVHV